MDLDTNILPWIGSNSLYPEYQALTWRRLIIIAASFMTFGALQKVIIHGLEIPKRRAFKVVSLIHSVVAVLGSLYVLTTYHSLLSYNTGHCKPIPMADQVLSVSFGYFVYDLYKTLTQEPSPEFILHGILCILIYGIVIHTAAGQAIGLSVLLYESSTIFLHSYALLHYAGFNFLASIVRFVFAFVFFAVRICFGSWMSIQMYHAWIIRPAHIEWNCVPPHKYGTAVAINLLFHCLNIHWLRLIVNKALKVWREGKGSGFVKAGDKLDFDQHRESSQKVSIPKVKET